MTKKTKSRPVKQATSRLQQMSQRFINRRFSWLVVVLAICAAGVSYQAVMIQADSPLSLQQAQRQEREAFTKTIDVLAFQANQLVVSQAANGVFVVSDHTVQQQLASLRNEVLQSDFEALNHSIKNMKTSLSSWRTSLQQQVIAKQVAVQATLAQAATTPAVTKVIPIIMYHHYVANFEAQVQYLLSKGYTTINMATASAALQGKASLPAKPVVLTFDDGYADQINYFEILQKYHLKGTFYIITGGPASKWCIGADRHWDQGYSCGDFYLSWSQISQMDASGVAEIGDHTVDHPYLAKEPAAEQQAEITNAKTTIESHLGHAVTTFSYPYGSDDATTVALVTQDGFSSAVTTQVGIVQSSAKLMAMYRIQNVYSLH